MKIDLRGKDITKEAPEERTENFDIANLLGAVPKGKEEEYQEYLRLSEKYAQSYKAVLDKYTTEELKTIYEAMKAAFEVLGTFTKENKSTLDALRACYIAAEAEGLLKEKKEDKEEEKKGDKKTEENQDPAEPLPELYKKVDFFSILLASYTNGFFNGDLEPFTDDNGQKAYKKTVTVKNRKDKQIALVDLKLLPSELNEGIYIEKPLDPYDKQIVNALHTIYESGARRFTPMNVYEVMTGDKTRNMKAIADIRERIMKLDDTRVSLRLEEMEKIYGKPKDDKAKDCSLIINSRIINVDNIRWKDEYNKSTWQDGFIFLKEPTLSTVCKAYNNQIATVNAKYLRYASKKVSNTSSSIPLKNTLLQRISQLRSMGSTRILLETLYRELQIDTSNRTQLQRAREDMCSILDSWKDTETEERLFKDYKIVKKGKKIYAIDFIF